MYSIQAYENLYISSFPSHFLILRHSLQTLPHFAIYQYTTVIPVLGVYAKLLQCKISLEIHTGALIIRHSCSIPRGS